MIWNSEPLGNGELLAKTDITVINARLAQGVPPDGSVCPQSGLSEAGRIDALELRSQIALDIAARHDIRVRKLAVVHALNIVPLNGVREAGLEGGNAGYLPAANCQVFHPVDSAPESLAAPKGQLIHIAGDEPFIDIEVRRSVVQVRVMVVLEALIAGSGGAHAGCRRLDVQAPGPGKDCSCGQIVSAMLEFDVGRVVVGIAVEVAVDVKAVEIWIGQAANRGAGSLAEVDVGAGDWIGRLAEGHARRRDWIRLRDIASIEEMR